MCDVVNIEIFVNFLNLVVEVYKLFEEEFGLEWRLLDVLYRYGVYFNICYLMKRSRIDYLFKYEYLRVLR